MTANNAISRKLDAIRTKGAMQSVDVANLLGLRPETVSRWNQGKAFPRPGAERTLLELEYIVDELSDFYEPADARLWLYSPQKLLGGARPADLIQAGDTQQVIETIDQLRDGVYL
ncbi:MAG: MbcA/ParS/Xre antitoxin family protein [Gammaproteobacteria bacterium]|nr:MbcA/ParS/Xre antitoxin family protein [Gammaproteobacteria bacterium]